VLGEDGALDRAGDRGQASGDADVANAIVQNAVMVQGATAIIQQSGSFWIGWVVEVPGINGQGETREDLLDSPRSAFREALEMNRDRGFRRRGRTP
jgi:predicted RNase H-like HicB family nuclease